MQFIQKYKFLQRNDLVFIGASVMVVMYSFFTYAPCFFEGFNSDHAIHVLMSVKFTWPHDIYYWGQNRLGSFFPLVASVFIKLFPKVHALYICSILQYILLLLPTLVLMPFLQNKWLKFLLLVLVFLPMNEFHVLLLLGHPYLGQYFCGVFFLYFGYVYLKIRNEPGKNFLPGFYLIASILFFTLSVWVSESSAILILIPVLYLMPPPKPFKRFMLEGTKLFFLTVFFCLFPSIIILIIKSYHLKGQNAQYDTLFFFNPAQIAEQLAMLWFKIKVTITFSDGKIVEDLFYYFLTALLIWLGFIKKEKGTPIIKILLITAAATFVFLFFANWNLLNKMPSRFYIPVYLLVAIALLFYIEKQDNKKFLLTFCLSFIGLTAVFQFYNKSIRKERDASVMTSFSDFRKLSKGTLIGDYWDVYLINSVASKNLFSIPYDGQYVRNRAILSKPLTTSRFYFINDGKLQALIKDDMVHQFDKTFYFTGQKIKCNGKEIWVFTK